MLIGASGSSRIRVRSAGGCRLMQARWCMHRNWSFKSQSSIGGNGMRAVILSAILTVGVGAIAAQQVSEEAVTGFDSKGNGMVDEATHQADKEAFDEVEGPEK